ncbi:MAG: DUF4349 domain-containing protein [Lachnospiraceae bacterium]|nr:DUF4349 domain-containing protein [Lachnospiraceae bacterium]
MKKKSIRVMGLALALSAMIAGCGAAENSASMAADSYADMESAGAYDGGDSSTMAKQAYAAGDEAYEETEDVEADDSAPEAQEEGENVAQNRKLIKRVSLQVETREFDKLTSHIEKTVSKLGGYMENSEVYSGNSYGTSAGTVRHASYTARVPVAKMNDLVEDVGENGNVTNKSESAEDVTLNYVDNQSRKEALEVEMDRLMEILKQAEDVDTIVALEQRITDVRYEIQNIESKLRTYDNLVDFATVSITVNEVEVYTPEPVKEVSDWDRMVEGFMHSLKSVGRGIVNFFIGLVIALPYLFVWAVVILIGFLIVRKIIRGKGKRAEKRAAKKAAKMEKAAQKAAQKRGQYTMQNEPQELILPGNKPGEQSTQQSADQTGEQKDQPKDQK